MSISSWGSLRAGVQDVLWVTVSPAPASCSPQATTWKLSRQRTGVMIPGRLHSKCRHPSTPLSTFQLSGFPVMEEFMGIREALDFPDTRLLRDWTYKPL